MRIWQPLYGFPCTERATNCRLLSRVKPGAKAGSGQVERVVLAHQDRLARCGYQLLVHLCETHQCELVVMNTEALSPEQELVQDFITITHCFSSRMSGSRNYRKALKKAIADDQSAQDPAPSDA
jgi:predicted site-specific integrase-resolvase